MSDLRSTGFRTWRLVTTALCGAQVMVIEVLGSRVIEPYFGVSLFVWTALITVALLSLAVGHVVGGDLADRLPSPGWFYGIILVAGVFTGVAPWLTSVVIQLSAPLGLRLGALISATVLFGPTLLLLGCVSPYLVRIATRGVLAINVIGNERSDSPFVPVVTKTLAAYFSKVAVFPVIAIEASDQPGGNIGPLAWNGDLPPAYTANFGPVHCVAEDGGAPSSLVRGAAKTSQGNISTDDFNPLDVLNIGLHEWIRAAILKITPSNTLLYN